MPRYLEAFGLKISFHRLKPLYIHRFLRDSSVYVLMECLCNGNKEEELLKPRPPWFMQPWGIRLHVSENDMQRHLAETRTSKPC
jgi:hypothetical protein